MGYRADRAQLIAAQAFANLGWRQDSAPSLFLQTQLQDIEAQTYEPPAIPLVADTLVPIRTVPRGVQESGYYERAESGQAQWYAAQADDVPRVAVSRTRTMFPVLSYWTSYVYSLDEIEAAQQAGIPLDSEYARVARDVIDKFRNDTVLVGDANVGLTGFINNANISAGSATNGDWDTATPDEILADLNGPLLAMATSTYQTLQPDTVALPWNKLAKLQMTPRSSNSDMTLEKFFLATQSKIRNFVGVTELSTAGAGGTNRMIIYKRDPSVVEQIVAILFDQRPPQISALNTQVICRAKVGGVNIKAPIAVRYVDGI